MATRTVLVDDLDGSDAHNSINFSVDGVFYEIDLSDENAAKLRSCLAPFIEAARRVSGPRGASNVRSLRPAPTAAKGQSYSEQLRAIREWARKQGHDISDRGRIPETILEEFRRAHAPKPREISLQGPASRQGGGGANNKEKKSSGQAVEVLFSHQD